MSLLAGIGLMVLAAAVAGAALRIGLGRPEATPEVSSEPGVSLDRNGHRVVDLTDIGEEGRISFETVYGDGSATVRVTGTLDEVAALELAEYLSALLARGSDRLILDTRNSGPVPRIVDALSGVAIALEQRGAQLALVGRRGQMLAALVTLRANGLDGAIYVFDSLDEATRGVGHRSA